MAALHVFQWGWLGTMVVFADEPDTVSAQPAPQRDRKRSGGSTRRRATTERSANG
jgi:hypothetical protein